MPSHRPGRIPPKNSDGCRVPGTRSQERTIDCRGLQPSELSYKKECQEKHLPSGSVPRFFSRHSAQLFERSRSMRAWSSSRLCPVSFSDLNRRKSPISSLWRRQSFPETNKPDGYPLCDYPLCEWQRMVLSETRGLWLSWIVRGGIGFSPEALVLRARSAPEKFG